MSIKEPPKSLATAANRRRSRNKKAAQKAKKKLPPKKAAKSSKPPPSVKKPTPMEMVQKIGAMTDIDSKVEKIEIYEGLTSRKIYLRVQTLGFSDTWYVATWLPLPRE